jgi:hypothetical protein
MEMTENRGILTDDQAAAVLRAAVEVAGSQTADDLRRVLDWAVEAAVQAATLRLVLAGEAGMFVRNDGELILKAMRYAKAGSHDR